MVNMSSKKRPRESNSSSDESESENEFQVEAVVDKRIKGKKVQYLLKWKGYSDADNTVSLSIYFSFISINEFYSNIQIYLIFQIRRIIELSHHICHYFSVKFLEKTIFKKS